jgi:Family of unknown function (DUF6519)
MKGDFSKATFNAKKHYHDVLMQQGRVLVDAEWNEQSRIISYRTETGVSDIIGQSGAPVHHAGFDIVTADPTNITISKGRFYVDGILVENETDLLFANQPDFNGTTLPTDAGTYIFYLDVWQRLITALEDPDIREVALGGPDTTTRLKTIWQVKFIKGTDDATCLTGLPASVTTPPTGKLSARSEPPTGTEDPCGLVTSGGYRRLENQLYRVEIHSGGPDRSSSTFKWSRDNGSVLVKWVGQDSADANKLIVNTTGRDDLLGIESGNWIELIDNSTDLLSKPGILVQVAKVDGNIISINPATILDPSNPGATSVTITNKNPRIRRWDSLGPVKMNTDDATWVPLEDGVQVLFAEGSFNSGDFWMIPARTAKADIEWPYTDPQLPRGIHHHIAELGIAGLTVAAAPTWTKKSDCRHLFPPLTEFTSMYYVGGDGQEASPGSALPNTLKVGVANGAVALPNANIKFEILSGGGSLNPAGGIVPTNASGIAECAWTLGTDTSNASLQVKASLLDAGGNVLADHLPVIFGAGFNIAGNNNTKRKCSYTVGKGGDFETIKEAIEVLSKDNTEVCICLLPGNQDVQGILGNQAKPLDLLKISACGAVIRIISEEFELIASRIVLQGLIFEKVQSPKGQLKILSDDIDVHHCTFRFEQTMNPDNNLLPVMLGPLNKKDSTPVVRWNNNWMKIGYALYISNGFDAWIENNDINGTIELQFDSPFKALQWENLGGPRPIREKLVAGRAQLLIQNPGTIQLKGNFLNTVVMNGAELLNFKPQRVYASVIISENIFRKSGNSFVAISLNMINNQFMGTSKSQIVAFVMGNSGIIMGNIEMESNGAIIDTIFVRPPIDPKLNLIGVS